MISRRSIFTACLLFSLIGIAACQADSRQQILSTDQSQVSLRSIQSRLFETNDTDLTVRTVISTLQDLGFVIDKADTSLGLVTASKAGDFMTRMTVTIRKRTNNQTLVRANGQYNLDAISEPQPYQQFFAALSQALFLTANEVN